MGNGAVFGAVYANVAPLMPIPPALRGPVVALVEHVVLWPLGALSDRVHPAREELPKLNGNREAFPQATWRHLLFGLVLGELERRVNAEPEPAPPSLRPTTRATATARSSTPSRSSSAPAAGPGGYAGPAVVGD